MSEQLTNSAKTLIREEVDIINKSQKDAIDKFEQYNKSAKQLLNIAKIILFLITGGSIGFLVTLESQIEDKVTKITTKQIASVDDLSTAVNLTYIGEHKNAINMLSKLATEVTNKDNKDRVNQEFKINVLKNSLWAISDANIDINGDWAGRELWDILKTNQEFKLILQEINSHRDWTIQLSLANVEARFYSLQEKKESIRNRLIISYKNCNTKNQQADIAYVLSLFHLTTNEKEKAKQFMEEAGNINPAEYGLNDWSIYKNSFLNSNVFLSWKKINADHDNNTTLESKLIDLVNSLTPSTVIKKNPALSLRKIYVPNNIIAQNIRLKF